MPKAERKATNKAIRAANEEIEIAAFLQKELTRYETPFGKAFIDLCRQMADDETGKTADFEQLAIALPGGANKEERTLRSDAISNARAVKHAARLREKHPERDVESFSADDYEKLFDLPEETKAQRQEKRRAIRAANKVRNHFGKVMKPYLWAHRHLLLSEAYAQIDAFTDDYPLVKARLDERRALEEEAARAAAAQRKTEALARRK